MSVLSASHDALAVITSTVAPTIGKINVYNANSGSLALTLPALSGLTVGSSMVVQKDTLDTSGNTVTFTRAGSDTFQDATTALVLGRPGSIARLEVVQPAATKYWKVTLYGAPEGSAYAAGTASKAPIVFTAGTLLTTPVAGAIEYDGTVFYVTPAALERHVLDAEQFITLTSGYTLTSQTAAQKLFNSPTNGALNIAVGTYFFECSFDLSSMSATSGAFGFAFGGNAVVSSQRFTAWANKATLATAAAAQSSVNTAANTAICTASTATVGWAKITGKISIGTAGTLVPQVSLGVAAAAVVSADSWFRIRPVGAVGVQSVGNWS